jgi:hypothetical protein
MRIRFLIVAGVVALAVVGCAPDSEENQPQAIPAETTVATTTTVAPTTTKPKGLGVTQTNQYEEPGFEGGTYASKITVFRYRDASVLPSYLESELAKESKRSVAIEVKACVTKAPPNAETSVSWSPWSLGDDQGASYEAWISYSGDETVQPSYPQEKITSVGTCRRGWVAFEVPRNWRPDFVEYNSGFGKVLKWPIKN